MANDASKVRIGATGVVWFAPTGTTLPTDPTTALNGAFVDVGYISSDGLSIDPEESASDIRAWGGDLVRRPVTEYGLSISFTMLERNANSLAAYFGNGSASAYEFRQVSIRKSWVFQIVDGVKIERIVLPDAEVTDRGPITYTTTDPASLTLTLSTYPNAASVHAFGYAA